MMTKNFGVLFSNTINRSVLNVKSITGLLKPTSPAYISDITCFKNPILVNNGNEINKIHMEVGSGSILPTIDDYLLEKQCEQLTPLSITTTYCDSNYENSTFCVNVSKLFKNNTDGEITIREIALFTNFKNSDGIFTVMLCREVIEPVVLQPGDTYTFSIEIGL